MQAAAQPESGEAAAAAAAAAEQAAAAAAALAAVPIEPTSELLMQTIALPSMLIRSEAEGKRAKGRGATTALFVCGGSPEGAVLLRLTSHFSSWSDDEPHIRAITLHMRAERLFKLQASVAGGSGGTAPWAPSKYAAASAGQPQQPSADVLLLDPPAGPAASSPEEAAADEMGRQALRQLAASEEGGDIVESAEEAEVEASVVPQQHRCAPAKGCGGASDFFTLGWPSWAVWLVLHLLCCICRKARHSMALCPGPGSLCCQS